MKQQGLIPDEFVQEVAGLLGFEDPEGEDAENGAGRGRRSDVRGQFQMLEVFNPVFIRAICG